MPSRSPRCLLTALAQAAILATTAGASLQAMAQGTPQRVEITGSAIKRIDGETALPVQVITRDEISKAGLTTAAEIVGRISAAAGNLTDGISMSAGGYRDQMGFNGANLRGVGVSSTLVLLNGRRMANFASPGDDAGVDLNNIPAAAIERVEILLDGASALYGSDAVAGVMNFITRRDYQGGEVSASAMGTQEGGAGKRTASVAAGFGDYGRDGFNVMAVLDVQKTDRLASSQRKFIDKLDIPGRLPHLLLSRTFPANIRVSSDQRDELNRNGFRLANGDALTERLFNLTWPTCSPPVSLNLPNGIGGAQGCTYNFMRDVELSPETDKRSLLARGIVNLGGGHQAFAEVALARATSHYVALPAPFTPEIDLSVTPVAGLMGYGLETFEDPVIVARLRFNEAGRQDSELRSTGERFVAGVNGVLGAWDYEAALNHSRNTVRDRAFNGYLNEAMIDEALADGRINAFGPSGAAGQALIAAAQIRGEVRSSTGVLQGLDFKFSRSLGKFGAGELNVALGGEFRRETQRFHQSPELAADLILGQTSQGPDADFSYGRNVQAVWGELAVPLAKSLEAQVALRHERYQRTGSATSPKLALRWQPNAAWLLRGSVGAGFRAPSMTDLYRPVTEHDGPLLADPTCLAAGESVTDCVDAWRVRTYANPDLKPEKSRQFSLGAVFEPTRGTSVSLDFWSIEKRNLISKIGAQAILADPAKYEGLVHRYNEDEGFCDYDPDDDDICFIELRKANRGRQKASGIDVSAKVSDLRSPVGSFALRLSGTLTLKSKEQSGNGDPFISNLGRFVEDKVVQRWRHTVAVDWERGPFSMTLANSYLSSYTDQNNAPDPNTGTYVAPNRVKAYSIWDLSGSWQAMPGLVLRGGVQNLLNTAPPFSNQADTYLAGYDPGYTDPRGRRWHLSATYSFR
ncbi:MAG TPA: TonB-dependent receptor [Aquabacterium sp.]|nr:TonB-dependent receptor [Aquabacterium sp.]